MNLRFCEADEHSVSMPRYQDICAKLCLGDLANLHTILMVDVTIENFLFGLAVINKWNEYNPCLLCLDTLHCHSKSSKKLTNQSENEPYFFPLLHPKS